MESKPTVWKEIHSKIAEDFTEELLRKQTADITNCPDIETRLKYRDRLLNKLIRAQKKK